MIDAYVTLTGKYVRLEPLTYGHIEGLASAASIDPTLYRWSPVPQGRIETTAYVYKAYELREAGSAMPFAIVRRDDNVVIGSTRFFNIEYWLWPGPRPNGRASDACEIGYTWLTPSAIRTAANTEAKLLLLTHAFEKWLVERICLHSDARNQRSRLAIERIGGQFEGILRAHRLAADLSARDSARFSILAREWPEIKTRLEQRLEIACSVES